MVLAWYMVLDGKERKAIVMVLRNAGSRSLSLSLSLLSLEHLDTDPRICKVFERDIIILYYLGGRRIGKKN